MSKYSYTEEELRQAISTSLSIRQVLEKLGIIAAGGNYRTIHNLIEKYELDISHFTGQGWNKGRISPETPKPIEDYLSNRIFIQSHRLKLRLIKDELKRHKCEVCKLSTWQNKPIPIELDHIDGDHKNNELSNLRILCPNCHAQTSTYRGKNKKPKA